MNNKWYSLTRPAVVQFNPPRDRLYSVFGRGGSRRTVRRGY
jgi:hypothetical protein